MPPLLPAPDTEAAEHSRRLCEAIRRDIAAHCDAEAKCGWISFARYMELALYAPGLGYYTAGAHKFGAAGDFVTAPELSPLFGRTLARQAAEIMGFSAPHILELGAGSGKLAADMLAELENTANVPDSYAILEVSADLRARQQDTLRERLPHLMDRVHWRDSAVSERGVALGENGFVWQEQTIGDAALLHAAQQARPWPVEAAGVPDDYVSEICLAACGLVNSLANRLQRGAMLFIDYGFGAREYYHPQRSGGTLMCHYRHHAHGDPFFLPGLQDITAHVNFTGIAECGIDAGLELLGYTSQAFFLINCGIAGLLQDTPPENLRAYLPLSAQLQKLTSPAEMGELFKVIALARRPVLNPPAKPGPGAEEGIASPLSGFIRGDLTRSL